ncbi:Putative fatty acyl-CoA reductase CG5065 [Gryllus bimaculatus]|nr:Putative fatty acyl-CoA reductase CG5065 [Gryllus bimaculatus]
MAYVQPPPPPPSASTAAAPAASPGPIADFFRGRAVLVTGATGFMGKVLVEKLLRSCPEVATVFLLMRPKRGQDPELGIGATDQRILAESVSVVFHAAATVKFDEKLKLSVAMNVQGTSRLVQLCHRMAKLEALVHVSTAYCNCTQAEVEERVYAPPADPEQIAQCIEWMDDELIDGITPKILGDHPNTYTFTKALAENVLVSQAGNLPAAIVRPSIVTASWREPLPGWVDNLNGPTGLLAGAGKGLLRTMYCHRNLVSDIVPVDIAINLLLAVAWHTAVNRPNGIAVYNCTSGSTNPLKWGQIEEYGREFVRKIPFNDVIWYPGGSFKSNRLLNAACHVALHLAPAYALDAAARISGRKPIHN